MLGARIEKIAEVNRRRRPDRERALTDDLLSHARKLLLEGDPAAYLAGFDDEFRDRVVDALLTGDVDAARTALGAARARGVSDAAILARLETARAAREARGQRRGRGRRWRGGGRRGHADPALRARPRDALRRLRHRGLAGRDHVRDLPLGPAGPLRVLHAARRRRPRALLELRRAARRPARPAAGPPRHAARRDRRPGRGRGRAARAARSAAAGARARAPRVGAGAAPAGVAAAQPAAQRAPGDLPQRGARDLGGGRGCRRVPRRASRPAGPACPRPDIDARVDRQRPEGRRDHVDRACAARPERLLGAGHGRLGRAGTRARARHAGRQGLRRDRRPPRGAQLARARRRQADAHAPPRRRHACDQPGSRRLRRPQGPGRRDLRVHGHDRRRGGLGALRDRDRPVGRSGRRSRRRARGLRAGRPAPRRRARRGDLGVAGGHHRGLRRVGPDAADERDRRPRRA